MKLKALISLTFLFTLFSCNNKQKKAVLPVIDSGSAVQAKKTDTSIFQGKNYLKNWGDSILIDPFDIEIVLSEKAKERIVNSNETIIVSIFFYGYPKDNKKPNSEYDGTLYLVGDKKEITYGQIVQFENIKISKRDYDQLIDKDFELNLNVFSGRKSSQDNLLDCKALFGKVSNIVNKKHTIKGKLIYGDQ